MKKEHFLIVIFFLLSAVFFYLFYQIIIPFFVPICWAAVLVIIFRPVYDRLHRYIKSRGACSLLMCLMIVVLIIGPVGYLFTALVKEAADAVARVNEMYRAGELDELLSVDIPFINAARDQLSKYYDLSQINTDQLIKDALDKVSSILFNQTRWLIANATKAIFFFLLMLFTMYYFFRDGGQIIHRMKRLTPMAPDQVDITFNKLRDVIQATMYGGVTVALIQGLLGGILFAIIGISSAVFWGAIMALLSIIPLLGAFVIYVPAGIILFIGGSYVKGIVVIGVGTVLISQIDNVIRPLLISGRTSIHPLMLFFAIMGGIAMFGLLGVVLGPLIAAIFVTVLEVLEYRLHPCEDLPAEVEAEPESQ